MALGSIKKQQGKMLIHTIYILFCIFILAPFILVLSISLSQENEIMKLGYSLLPRSLTFEAYEIIFKNPYQILNAYKISILMVVIGTSLGLLFMSMAAYAMSRRDYKLRYFLSMFVFITMLFNGGIVPFYLLIRELSLVDKFPILIIPSMVNAFFIILLRTYFQKLPMEIVESAKIDGAREIKIFFTLIVPLSKPAMATVALLLTLNYWNEWYFALLFVTNRELQPIQLLLYNMMINIEFVTKNVRYLPPGIEMQNIPNEAVRMAMCIVAAGPMLVIFPFFQKYFIKGLTVGSVKG